MKPNLTRANDSDSKSRLDLTVSVDLRKRCDRGFHFFLSELLSEDVVLVGLDQNSLHLAENIRSSSSNDIPILRRAFPSSVWKYGVLESLYIVFEQFELLCL